MATPAGAFEDITTELKNAYPPGTFEEPVNKMSKYRRDIQRVDLVMNEGIARFPLGIASSWNVGMIPDIGEFPTPVDPVRVQGEVTPELFVGSFSIGVKTKVAAKSKKGTFNQGGIMADRVENTVAELGKYINKVYAGSQGNADPVNVGGGVLATVETNLTPANTLVLNKPLGAELLNRNMRIDAKAPGGALRALQSQTITVLTRDTRTIVYDGADDPTVAAGDEIYIENTSGRSIWTLSMIVGDASDTALIFGQSRATYPELNAFVEDAGGNDLTEQLILNTIDLPFRETGKRISKALTNTGQARKYVEFIQAERRYPGPTGSAPRYTVGYDEDSLQIIAPGINVKLEVDTDIEPRRIYFLAWEVFGRYTSMDVDWIDDDALLKMIPTAGGHRAGFLAYVGCVENQINTMPRASARLENLQDPISPIP
jgi:hypothetical protein